MRSFQNECFIDRDKPVSEAEGKREVRVTAEVVGRLPRAGVRALPCTAFDHGHVASSL